MQEKDKTVVTFIHFHTMVLLYPTISYSKASLQVIKQSASSRTKQLPMLRGIAVLTLAGVLRLQFLEKNKSSFGCSERYPVCDTPGT